MQVYQSDGTPKGGGASLTPAGTAEIADVATAEAAGTSATYARGDHVHALAANVVTDAKLRDSVGVSVIGRAANSTGDPADIAADADNKVLGRRGGSLTFAKLEPAELNFNAVRVLHRTNDSVEVQNDSTEQTVFTFTVPGNTIGATGALRLTLLGDYLNNSGSGDTIRFRVKFGATEMWGDIASTSIASNAERKPFTMGLMLANLNATNSQLANGELAMGSMSGAATTAGDGDLGGTVGIPKRGWQGTAAIDTTANADLVVTVQHTTASVNISFRRRYAILELLP